MDRPRIVSPMGTPNVRALAYSASLRRVSVGVLPVANRRGRLLCAAEPAVLPVGSAKWGEEGEDVARRPLPTRNAMLDPVEGKRVTLAFAAMRRRRAVPKPVPVPVPVPVAPVEGKEEDSGS